MDASMEAAATLNMNSSTFAEVPIGVLKRRMQRRLMRAGCILVFCMRAVTVPMRGAYIDMPTVYNPAPRAPLLGVEDVSVGGNDKTTSRGKPGDASADATKAACMMTRIGGEARILV